MIFFMAKFIDLTGTRVGRWLVTSKSDGANWNCLCDCGVTKAVAGSSLRRGISRSCGCLLRERAAETKINDLTGRRFGILTVIKREENSKHGDARWAAVCDCGTKVVVRSCNLVSGNSASCGCARINGVIVRPKEVREKSSARSMARYRSEPKFNLRARMANAIRISLRRHGRTKKKGRWEALVGYSVAELRARLESTLPEGKTWSDYLAGGMEIDHIVPLDAFNYQTETGLDFRRAWALTNLRLITAAENQSKGNKLTTPFQPSLQF